MQQRRHDPQVGRDRGLEGQQRQDPLVHLEVATVDEVVVGHDHAGQLDVLVPDRLQRPVERRDDQVEAAEGLDLELLERLAEVVACLLHRSP